MIFQFLTLFGAFLIVQGFAVAEDHHPHDEKTEHEHGHEGEEKDRQHSDHDGEESGEKEHGHDEEESTGGVGPNNAVTAADEHDGIKLSPKAIQFIGLQTTAYDGQTIPKLALVFYHDKIGVYRLREGWFKLLPVTLNRQSESPLPQAEELRAGDHIVIQGTGLLRVAELDAFSTEVGHGH